MVHQSLEAELPRLRSLLIRQARLVLSNAALAEDLVQDTLLAVVQHNEARRGDAKLSTWATAILKNKVADWYRSAHHQRTVQLPDDSDTLADMVDGQFSPSGHYTEPVAAWEQPDTQIAQKQMMKTLEACMACLPAQTGRVFMMREWLGFDTAEICTRLRVSPENCRTLLHRARTALRVCMQAHNPSMQATA